MANASPSSEVGPPPTHVISSPLRVTAQKFYKTNLQPHEETWRDRYLFLLSRGLELRFRYRPAWTPSWLGTDLDPATCDDSIRQTLHMVLDAKRREDGKVVCIKRIEHIMDHRTDEVKIGTFLSTEQMLRSPTNHCVPIWDSFCDPVLPNIEYIVMPVLRPYNDPPFGAIGEVVDFVTQLIEGMSFIHSNLVAHGDLTTENIMMDARPILPKGWHFVEDQSEPNGVDPIVPLARIDHPVRYVIVDYGCAVQFRPGQSHLLKDFSGRDTDPPELMMHPAYDAFKVDVFTLGNVFDRDFYQVYEGLDFLKNQIEFMKTPDSRQRPTAQLALERWQETRGKLDIATARWRLRERDEPVGLRVMRDAVSVVQKGLTRILNPQQQGRIRTWSNP